MKLKNVYSLIFAATISIVATTYISCKKAVTEAETKPVNRAIEAEYLIKNGLVYNGENEEPKLVDIGIANDTIVFIGNATSEKLSAKNTIDATNLIVTPGFIDPHTHCEEDLSSSDAALRRNLIYLRQGVTTVLTGNDGYGTTTTASQLQDWQNSGIGTNVGLFVGFGSVRNQIVGTNNVQPTATQLDQMKALVTKSMQEGAFGLSTALSYVPQSYSQRKGTEVKELAKVTKPFGGVYDTHLRSQSGGIIDAIKEVEEISEYAGNLKVHISHIKSSEELVDNVLSEINAIRAKGIDLTANVYPYLASSDGLRSLVAAQYRTSLPTYQNAYNNATSKQNMYNSVRNNLINIGDSVDEGAKLIVVAENFSNWRNKSIYDIALEKGTDPINTILDMLYQKILISVQTHSQSEVVMKKFLQQAYIVTGSDGGRTHPRGAGTFPEVIKKYANDQKVQSLKQAIHTSTGLTAQIFGIKKRGTLKVGNFADIVVLDLAKYKANATYQDPEVYATGVKHVFLNGYHVIEDDSYKGILAGKAVKKN